ncbi:BQ5605_C017g08453 [Microbotryum silenes-dioicae]|uniref:BQ5605_C017g08453 protein n=1 Tax=Microbotryum silenes-dioicae TaxID=796604 RepID=A0A2X0NYZ3_9BASI|nr:BQ5605_C017g08453 [Microbotryum silenes-dioicae]
MPLEGYCMSLESTGRWFNAVSGLVPEYFDTCVHSHVAFVGPRANQMSCDAKTKKPGPINLRTNKSQQVGTLRQQAVFLDPVPRIKAAFACAQQAKLLRSLYEDPMSFIKRRSESGNPDTGGYFDISSGQALARAHDLGAFHDERNCFFGISSDGALVQEQQAGSFWIWSRVGVPMLRVRHQSIEIAGLARPIRATNEFRITVLEDRFVALVSVGAHPEWWNKS